MPILLFLIDTSASMNQRTDLGTSYLDIAKGAVELFLKLRARDPASRGDRYMLVTYDEPPYCIKGRNPFFLEPSILITITDGNKLTSTSGVQEELHLPLNSPLPGSELTKEPFRWDQRLFALVLRLPGLASTEPEQIGSVPTDESAITQMCEVTGGRSYCVRTQRMLNQCLESLVQKVQSGVVINFEKTGPDPLPIGEDGLMDSSRPSNSFAAQPWHSCHKLIYVRPNSKTGVPVGHWPIPESFWPDQNLPSLVFVTSSGKYNELGYPFGYLKASTTLTCVNLFVMPYNYPVLLPLLDDLFKVHKLKPNLKWRQAFDSYLKTLPPYYLLPLKKALRMMGAPNLISDNLDCGLSYSVISYLKKLSQQTKLESERILASVGKKPPQEIGIKVKNHSGGGVSLTHNKNFRKLLKEIIGDTAPRLTELNTKEFAGFQVGLLNKDLKPQTYRNAYDIPRRDLLDQLTRMRSNLLKTHKFIVGQDEDSLHSVPVAQMGNYQEYLKTLASPLREIDPDQPKRLHTFGNPFKQDKKGMMIDEADEFVAGPQNKVKRPGELNSPLSSKRRRSVTVTHDVHEEKMENGQISPDGFLSKSASQELMNMAGDGIPPDQVDSLSDDFTSLREDGPIHKPGCNALIGETKNCSVSVDDQEVSVTSALEIVPSTLQITPAMAQGINADIKHQLMKEVRKFGRKYERIFTLLEGVQGPLAVKKQFVEFTIKEAARFKRRVLIQYLEKVLEKIESYHLLNNVNHINSRS
ncbi:hypothetical protein G4228_019546 [Cervus hanglu yarkandensis]|nr:hypothetical protein G4228_019546 [Cervus hanglu yarkandensis]